MATIDWKARIEEAKRAAEAAKAAITDDDRAEMASRAEWTKLEETRLEAEREKRELDLARRFDLMREELGPEMSKQLATISIQGREDTFIILHDSKAHAQWEKSIAESATNKKLDKADIGRAYAVALVVDWNGIRDFSVQTGSVNGYELDKHLKKNHGMVAPIVNEGARLAGFFAEERKS